MKGIYEFLTNKEWMARPSFVHGVRKALESNLATHAAFTRPEKTTGFVTAIDASGNTYYPEEYQISEDGSQSVGQWALTAVDEDGKSYQDFPFVSVLTVDGPITRNGGGCSYGSVEHRDMMMRAADHPLCIGHLFLINTPGGSAWAINDYKQAFDYVHSKGQKVIAFIDGQCCSAGMYLASICDEVYYMNPRDEVGCIGVMAAFYTTADGSRNEYSGSTYHEKYDPESFDKNKAFRDIANDDDDTLLIEELAALGREFRADIRKSFPAVTDDHIKGKVFNAGDVEGILVDGQSTFMGCVHRLFDLRKGIAQPIVRTAPESTAKEGNSRPGRESQSAISNQTPKTKVTMKEFPLTLSAMGVETLEGHTEDGVFVNTALLEALEASLASRDTALAEAKALAEQMTAQVQETKDLLEAANKQVADLTEKNQKQETALAENEKQINDLTEAKASAEQSLEEKKKALASAEQTIADKEATIQELTTESGDTPDAGASPASNGSSIEAPQVVCQAPTYDPNKSPVENKEAFDQYLASLRK